MLTSMALAIKQLQAIKDSTRGFAELMQLYEDNYVRFRRLVSGIEQMEGESRSIKYDDVTLHIQILDRSRYTTTLQLTYIFTLDDRVTRSPDLKVRIYHDALQAEVMSCCQNDPLTFDWLERSQCQTTMQWRWRINWFFHKWLNYCLKSGHGFPQEKSGINWSDLVKSVNVN